MLRIRRDLLKLNFDIYCCWACN